MIPYRAPGRIRQIAYAGILSVAATSATVSACVVSPLSAAPGCLAGYLLAYFLHEHVLWRAWSRWHGMPDLSGQWRHNDEHLLIRQTWTRLSIVGKFGGHPVDIRLAGWCEGWAVLQAVLTTIDHPMLAVEMHLAEDGALLLQSPAEAFPLSRWVR